LLSLRKVSQEIILIPFQFPLIFQISGIFLVLNLLSCVPFSPNTLELQITDAALTLPSLPSRRR
jgi:hypothetical protein